MLVKSECKHIRISPMKMRQVIDLIRAKNVQEAQVILSAVNKRATGLIVKILKSAVANAKVKGFTEDQLYISRITCDNGPSWKRFKAAAFGRASPILRRTSHLKIELDLKE
jgi:large subunit ribosomal protein L22